MIAKFRVGSLEASDALGRDKDAPWPFGGRERETTDRLPRDIGSASMRLTAISAPYGRFAKEAFAPRQIVSRR